MISIVIPLYNKAALVRRTLDSVFAQTYQDFEIVIVDDGSTDGSAHVVASIADARIRLISQQNAGVSAARNRGILEARGEYIALLDADDEWHPDYLDTQMSLVEKYPEAAVFATNYEFRDTNGDITPTIIRNIPFEGETGILNNYFEVASTSHPPICSISIMARKEAFEAIGGFPVGVRLGEDLITWAKLACRYKIAYTKKVCATYVFMSQSARIIPKKQPNHRDIVGVEYKKLVESYDIPFLKSSAAKWHKMRMVTFVQLNKRKDAKNEFKKIKSYIRPTKKDYFWYIMSFMPMSFVHFFLKHKSKFA